ncbi:MAG: hypothetical protein ACI8PZ_002438 [Myxococcota bacterium]|jgi:hypothetical protein
MRLGLTAATLLLASCNSYDMFRVAGYQQDQFNNQADILFVIDNSTSMVEEASSLAVNFGNFVQDLSEREAALSTSGLPDAVTNYIEYVQDRASFVDYQFGITTTDADVAGGQVFSIIRRGDSNVSGAFLADLLCSATCIADVDLIGNDPSYLCGEPIGDEITRQYMECTCGDVPEWLGVNCGSAREEALEAVFLSMCRSVANPPEECFAPIEIEGNSWPAALTDEDRGTNRGFLRDASTFIPVIVTDEGDDSRREPGQQEIPDAYLDLFKRFRKRIAWVIIGPALDDDGEKVCDGPATKWGTIRYEWLVYDSSGLKIDITDNKCETADFQAALEQLGALLQNLSTTFPLSAVPIKETLQVTVDGKAIDESSEKSVNALGFPQFSDGWTYRASENSVIFHGAAIPSAQSDVRVYYEPLDGMPRELPF